MKNIRSVLSGFALLAVALTSCNNGEPVATNGTPAAVADKQPTTAAPAQQQAAINKKIVADFYQELFGDKNVGAIDKYIGDSYIQHNPSLPDGKEALKDGVAQWFKGASKEKIDIRHLNAEDDLVYIHTKSKQGAKTVSVIDIFRLENGKITEHWDVMQEVPEKAANSHPMF